MIKRDSDRVPVAVGAQIIASEHQDCVGILAEVYGNTLDKPCEFASCMFLRTDSRPSSLVLKLEA